jgi:hypothetical protein
MEADKINTLAIRVVGIILSAVLVIGGAGACVLHLYGKGIIGIIAAPIIVFIAFQPASIKTWGLMVVIFSLVMIIVGEISK